MKRNIYDDKVTVRGHRCGRTPTPTSREAVKTSKPPVPLRPLNRGVHLSPHRLKPVKDFGKHSTASGTENCPVNQSTVRMSDKKKAAVDLKRLKSMGGSSTKSKPVAAASRELLHHERVGDGDLRRTLSHMEEKFTSASEELQATEEELTELRVALSNAKRTIEVLRTENMCQTEKIKSLTVELQKKDLSNKRQHAEADIRTSQAHQNEARCAESLLEQNRSLQKQIAELTEEKMLSDCALERSKAEISRIMLENNQLKINMEEERREWDQMQKDLLVAVKVANDFKMETQKEMSKLSEKITELQKRRLSTPFGISQGSLLTMYEEKPQTWEDKAWQRLMLGCERGSRRNALLRWCQQAVTKFPHVEITNFSTSWTNGQALCYLLASFYPDKLDIDRISEMEAEECLTMAVGVASALGVEVKVKVSDFRREDRPDWSLIMRYILNLYYVISDGSKC